ncbi:hypothetical protein U0033_28145 [Chitinophaga sancti]|uniref:Uncharacterized protein n=1 Tax=Chitinophaga sancti TaxID=1004 RepID=A0ABZ0XQL8_9BACT|nr:hypothetical protein [Chitinophaga sancti]WQD61451.1 hypothetical protein U0033_26600 [Chitinophaga sancti]WQD61757.1 hypothetical protein U0033_28145 [Chitinophaga sancti]WQG92685.1 hypothetical protein SR876_14295 [Chitinophaga sancti]WQG92992.1 hypothetical protein SR876_15840 [Chitinophaga sancti]
MLKELKKELLKALTNLKTEKFDGVYSSDQLNISDRVVGGKVELINADGSLNVAPDGDYELEDGFKFTVKDGVIASIEGEEQPEELANETPTEDTPAPDDNKVAIEELQKETAAIKAEVESIKEILAQLTGSVSDSATKEEMQKFSKEVKTLTDTINKVAKLPAEFSKTTKSTKTKTDNHDKLMDVIKLMKK